jgi:hypothetical protein
MLSPVEVGLAAVACFCVLKCLPFFSWELLPLFLFSYCWLVHF